MAISKEDLANRALFLANEKDITRLSDDNEAAIAINTIYEQVERETFEMPDDWNFCTTRLQLVEIANAAGVVVPVCGWDHQYGLPSNALRILSIVKVNGDPLQMRYRREVLIRGSAQTDVILMNDVGLSEPPYVRYIVYRTSPSQRPAWFNKLFYHDMALVVVKTISKEDPGKTTLERRREGAYRDAVAANGLEGADVNIHGENTDHGHDLRAVVNGKLGFRVTQRT